MTVDDFNKKLTAQIEVISKHVPLGIAAGDTHAMMVERIFDEGKTATGGIHTYDRTTEIYISTDQSPHKFTPKGKPSDRAKKISATYKKRLKEFGYTKAESKAILKHKTTYFQSYKAFRQALGFESGFWNLQLFGNLRNDFSTGLKRTDNDTWISFVERPDSMGKTEKFRDYFRLNKDERSHFKKVLDFELKKILNK